MGPRPQIIFFIVLIAVAIHHCVCFGPRTTIGAGTTSRRRCRPPQDTRALPDYAREAIRDIWKDYVPGARCEKEQLMTDDVLTVLETLDREFPGNTATAAGRGKRLHTVTVAEQRMQYLHQPSPSPLSSDRLHQKQSKVYAEEINGQDTEQEVPIVEGGGDDSVAGDEVPKRTVSSAPATRSRLPSFRSFTTTTKDGGNAAVIEDNDYAALEPEATSSTRQESLTPFPSSTPMGPIRHSTSVPLPSDYDSSEAPEPTTPSHGNRKKQQALVGGVKVGAAGAKRLEKEPFDYASLPDGAVTAPKQFEHSEQLPFLKEADPELVQLFDKVLNDPDTPSERRRQEEIHLLAVSYLSSKQLAAFNTWSTQRRKQLRDQELQLNRHSKQQ